MKLAEVVHEIVSQAAESLTPQEIRDRIKLEYRSLYDTEVARRSVAVRHHSDVDHALLAFIYKRVDNGEQYVIDR